MRSAPSRTSGAASWRYRVARSMHHGADAFWQLLVTKMSMHLLLPQRAERPTCSAFWLFECLYPRGWLGFPASCCLLSWTSSTTPVPIQPLCCPAAHMFFVLPFQMWMFFKDWACQGRGHRADGPHHTQFLKESFLLNQGSSSLSEHVLKHRLAPSSPQAPALTCS